MTGVATLRMESVASCFLCGAAGTQLYGDLQDRLYGVPGTFNFSQCPECRTVWLNPRPISEDIAKCYTNYHTHEAPAADDQRSSRRPPSAWRQTLRRLILEAHYGWPQPDRHKLLRLLAGRVLGFVPVLRRRATFGLDVLFPPWHDERRLLDVGCGSGWYLAQMRDLGWRVMGVEMDPQAAKVARECRQLRVFVGTLEEAQFPEGSFDTITMSHVLEHVPDPTALLKECYRLLSPGGHLILVVPNLGSLGHRIFRHHWRGLEPPRHLCLWRTATLSKVLGETGLRVLRCTTRPTLAAFIYSASQQIRRRGHVNRNALEYPVAAAVFERFERVLSLFYPELGEEVCALAQKPHSSMVRART
jgi:2-polyprenyl-3-methyl-5-hydroxy-6-metoxy-1,4-benzoquinol methylase